MKPLRIIQFSDLHLFRRPSGTLLNINTDKSFRAVVKAARKDQWPPDLVLLSGDLSQDGSVESYRQLARGLSRLKVPVSCLPGNHDIQSAMKTALRASGIGMDRQILHGYWNIVLLDSTLRGSHGGYFRSSELSFLKKCLKTYPKHHALICFHHPPFKTGADWLDTMKIKNAKAFLKIIDKNRHVRGVVFGHVHQTFSKRRNGVRYLGCPSTCIQFKPGRADFKLDRAAPGYQVITLGADGTIGKRVKRIKASLFKPDLSSHGYDGR